MKFWFGSKEETKKEEVLPMPEPAATAKPEPQPVVPPEPKPIVAPEPPPVVTPNLSMPRPPKPSRLLKWHPHHHLSHRPMSERPFIIR